MLVYANLSNGNQVQIKLEGDNDKIMEFINNYQGNDLGNDLVCEDFVKDFEETGVVIEV